MRMTGRVRVAIMRVKVVVDALPEQRCKQLWQPEKGGQGESSSLWVSNSQLENPLSRDILEYVVRAPVPSLDRFDSAIVEPGISMRDLNARLGHFAKKNKNRKRKKKKKKKKKKKEKEDDDDDEEEKEEISVAEDDFHRTPITFIALADDRRAGAARRINIFRWCTPRTDLTSSRRYLAVRTNAAVRSRTEGNRADACNAKKKNTGRTDTGHRIGMQRVH
ncbi:hypothetical protein DBV15_00439 [Temnothorax longispinosus]|uniref:Uncharacterized protein n=1 Tax=Temnothorax longispinosus TaxID=300112 RepID=A0A4S2JUP6_9HYME|nr:hypothetical protein DBV15_00439 [Temnothorax longispinosus]